MDKESQWQSTWERQKKNKGEVNKGWKLEDEERERGDDEEEEKKRMM